jgi:phosphoglycerol transferase MdoB-like AlkP superfamily enzyme
MKTITYFLRLLLFWIVFFLLQQILFFFFGSQYYLGTWQDFLISIALGMRMNLAAAMYLCSVPILFLIFSFFVKKDKQVDTLLKYTTLFLLGLCCVLCAADIGIYKAWGTKFNAKALSYLAFPKDVFPVLFARETFFLFPLLIFEFWFFKWLRNKIVRSYEQDLLAAWRKIVVACVMLACFIIGARGGIQKLPLNRNQIFVSEHALLNYAAMNSFWNLAELLSHPKEPSSNPYPFYSDKLSLSYCQEFEKVKKDSTQSILKNNRPNIVLVFLESWTADLIASLGGEKNVAPYFDTLSKEGMSFSNFYSTGFRTEQGLLAMLSAQPAQPQGSAIYAWGKFDKLPNLFTEMNKQGYGTSFYYGGRLQFDNVEAYLRSAGVKHMVGENNFEIKKRVNWGAYDEEIFALHLKELQQTKEPFFSMLGTITTHEWWDSEVTHKFKGSKDELADKFRNTLAYSDSCLYAYIQNAKKQKWYANTLFVLLADHGCRYPLQRNNFESGRYHIPMLLLGGALKEDYKGIINDKISSHTDLPATLLNQMQLNDSLFPRSKNIFNRYSPEFAYYTFDNGFGLITKDKTLIYDHYQQKDINNSEADAKSMQLLTYGKAYLQTTNSFNIGLQK